jgi:plastocyanin
VAHPLSNITEGDSSTVLAGVSLASLLTGGYAINAHNLSDPSVYTACGDLPDWDMGASNTDVAEAATPTPGVNSEVNPEAVQVALQNFRFSPGELVASPGQTISLVLTADQFPHTFSIDDLGVNVVLGANTSQSVDITIPPDASGSLPFVCRFHEVSGMVGTLRIGS